jgi:hypothetical protein
MEEKTMEDSGKWEVGDQIYYGAQAVSSIMNRRKNMILTVIEPGKLVFENEFLEMDGWTFELGMEAHEEEPETMYLAQVEAALEYIREHAKVKIREALANQATE